MKGGIYHLDKMSRSQSNPYTSTTRPVKQGFTQAYVSFLPHKIRVQKSLHVPMRRAKALKFQILQAKSALVISAADWPMHERL